MIKDLSDLLPENQLRKHSKGLINSLIASMEDERNAELRYLSIELVDKFINFSELKI